MFADTYFSCLTTCIERVAIISLNIGNFGKSDEKRNVSRRVFALFLGI